MGLPAIRLNVELDSASDNVRVDAVQIQQVFFNLIRNAAEAMRDQPRREITIRAAPAGGASIEVTVADTGPGLPEHVRANLFKPFITTKLDGMGLGLSICRTIIANHGGDLHVEGPAAGGTVFRFTLPTDQVRTNRPG